MQNGFVSKLLAIRQAAQIGCSGAHQNHHGEWIPCSSIKQYMSMTEPMSVKSRTTILEMEKRSSRRKKKGRKRRKRWENLRERGVGGINSTPGVGLTSWNGKPGNSVGIISGGRIPGIFYGNPNPPNVPGGFATKSLEEKSEQYSPRDNDTDVFIDIESARRRARQLGCIGVSRRISKSGKTVWMPCTNLTDYNNLTGMTALGRLNQEKNTQRAVRTVLSQELKKRKKSLVEEIMGKAIGPKIAGVSRFAARSITQRFDPNAEDGDGDGLLQDGTAFERPSLPGNVNRSANNDITGFASRSRSAANIERDKKIIEEYNSTNSTISEIAEQNNLSLDTVTGILRAARRRGEISERRVGGLKPKNPGSTRASAERNQKIIDAYNETDLTIAEIAREQNVSLDVATSVLKRARLDGKITEKRKAGKKPKKQEVSESSIDSVRAWFDKTPSSRRQELLGEPIENFSVRGRSTRGFASMSKPVKSEDFGIVGLENPEASPTNPFRNLGGKKMGEIIRGLVKPKNKGKEQRTTYLIGGTTGGGKTTVLDEHLVPKGLVPARDEAAHVDPDFVKMGLPGYNDGAGAPMVHDESLRAAQYTMDDAREEGADVVATGAGSTRQRAIIAQARRNGDRVVAHWVHISQPEASRRLKERERKTGRKIPDQTDHFARSIPRMVSSAVSNGEVDEFYIWDNEVEPGQPPRLLASFKDGKLEVFDQKKLDEFMNGNPLNPKPGDKSVLSDEAREALRESDEFMAGGFASGGRKKPKSRYTPPKNKPTYDPSDPLNDVPPPGIPGALPPQGIPGSGPNPGTPGRVGTSSPFGDAPGTGAVTSVSNIEGIDEIIEKAIISFIDKLKNRLTERRDGTPKNALDYVLKKLERVKTGIAYQREQGIAGREGPLKPFDLTDFSLKGKLDNPVAIRRVVENFVPVRGGNETEEEFIERLFDTIPALKYSHISDMPNRVNYMKNIMRNIGYDARAQKDLRKLLETEIITNKAFRELVEEFGLPVMFNGTGMIDGKPMGGVSAFHTPYAALVVVGKHHIQKGKHEAIGSTFDNKKFDTVQETIRHEWFHYLDSILMAADEATFDARVQTYEDGLRELVADPEAVVRKITAGYDGKTLEERFLANMTLFYLDQHPNWSPERARQEAIKFMTEQLQNNRDEFIVNLGTFMEMMIFNEDMIADILRDRGGILDEVAGKYSQYARYGVHELIAEVGRMITSTASERSRPDNNIAEITEETVDLLIELFPSISRAQWLNIIRLSNPGLQIKVLGKS